MRLSSDAVPVAEILPWRVEFRSAAPGQIVHDSLHSRVGWTQSYLLSVDDSAAGYGAVAVGGPWQGTKTVFEFHVSPAFKIHAVGLFAVLLRASEVTHFEIQTKPPLLLQLASTHVQEWTTDRIIFRDEKVSTLPSPVGAVFRKATEADAGRMFEPRVEPVGDWVVEVDRVIAATGGWLSHYNPPYSDLFMEVAEPFRRRGIGSWLLQELKRACRTAGGIPCARCSPGNAASRRCLGKAGFAPWCEIVSARISSESRGI